MGPASKEVLGNNDKVQTIKFQSLRRDFENSKMKDYFSRLMELVNQMDTLGEKTKNKRMARKNLDNPVSKI